MIHPISRCAQTGTESNMLTKIGEPAPPKGLKLKLFRAPLYFYRFKLGFLLGERFIRYCLATKWMALNKIFSSSVE